MPRPSIEGSRAKWRRAKEHLDTLDERVSAFFKDSHSVVVESDSERGYYAFRLRNPRPIPHETWSLLIGDCVHNMRSALDYIAWELAGAHLKDRNTMFPVYDDPKKFADSGARRIKTLPDPVKAAIRNIQPYATPGGPRNNPLWAIETLDVSDKHKLLTVTIPRPTEDRFIVWTPQDDPVSLYKLKITDLAGAIDFEDNAVFTELRVSPPCPDMKVTTKPMPFDIAFDWELGLGLRKFVVPTLRGMLSGLGLTIDLFDEKFFRKPP